MSSRYSCAQLAVWLGRSNTYAQSTVRDTKMRNSHPALGSCQSDGKRAGSCKSETVLWVFKWGQDYIHLREAKKGFMEEMVCGGFGRISTGKWDWVGDAREETVKKKHWACLENKKSLLVCVVLVREIMKREDSGWMFGQGIRTQFRKQRMMSRIKMSFLLLCLFCLHDRETHICLQVKRKYLDDRKWLNM